MYSIIYVYSHQTFLVSNVSDKRIHSKYAFCFLFNFYWCSILRGVNLKINKKEIVLVRINKRRYEDDKN